MDISKADWKLFRERLPLWQERYTERLCKEYVELLSNNKSACERFWALEKRIRNDRKAPGVILDLKKSEVPCNIIRLVQDDIITLEDLSDFSETLQVKIKDIVYQLDRERL